MAGQHVDTGKATGDFGGVTYTDTDDAHYFGADPSFTVTKSCHNDPVPQEGPAIFKVEFVNTGNVDISVTADEDLRDVYGNVVHPKGTSFALAKDANPTFYVFDYGVGDDPFSGVPTVSNTINATGEYTDGAGNVWQDIQTPIGVCAVADRVALYKTTNGQPADPTKDIVFTLYDDGGAELETQSTLGNGANIQFQTALVPGADYTICENPVPAGYTFEITINGGNVLTYAGDATGQIQCFDFTAPDYPPTGATVTFNVENSFPGGAPRTPGYWKNWNRCSGGRQAETADKLNGGLDPSDPDSAGVYLLDDLLPQTIGSFEITSCEVGVLVLDSRSVDKEKKTANDAAYTLARALLAARLNQDAGACTAFGYDFLGEYGFDGTFEQLLSAADDVLSAVEFDGTGSYLAPKNLKKDKSLKPLAEEALFLYEIIDDYNNGYVCTGEPSH
jgi:hypothetical protein